MSVPSSELGSPPLNSLARKQVCPPLKQKGGRTRLWVGGPNLDDWRKAWYSVYAVFPPYSICGCQNFLQLFFGLDFYVLSMYSSQCLSYQEVTKFITMMLRVISCPTVEEWGIGVGVVNKSELVTFQGARESILSLAESIPRNRFLGSFNVYKYEPCFMAKGVHCCRIHRSLTGELNPPYSRVTGG